MDRQIVNRLSTGRYERVSAGGEEISALTPDPLPPANPPLIIEGALADQLRRAQQALARLKLAGEMVPSLDWFIYAFVRKEAVLSSQIEGTQATLVDLLTFEAGEQVTPNADVEEVCNYLDAMSYARGERQDSMAAWREASSAAVDYDDTPLNSFKSRGASPMSALSP